MDGSGGVTKLGSSGGTGIDGNRTGEVGTVTDQYGVGGTVRVEADSEAWYGVFAVGVGVGFALEDFDDYGSGEDWPVG